MIYAGFPTDDGIPAKALPTTEDLIAYLDDRGISSAIRQLRDEGGPYRRAFRLEVREAFNYLSGIMTIAEYNDPFKDVMVLSGEDDILNADSWYLNAMKEYMNLRVREYGFDWDWLINQPKNVVDFVFDHCAKMEKDKSTANANAMANLTASKPT